MLKGPNGNAKLERPGGLDYFVGGGEERSAFPAVLTPGSVDGGYCRKDNVDIEHLRGSYLEFDLRSMTMRGRQHRRQDEGDTGEKSVRVSLEECQWTTMGESICWLRCEERERERERERYRERRFVVFFQSAV